MILKVESTPNSGDWQIIGASSSHSFTLGNELLDVSDKDTNRWRSLLSAGDRSASISMEGFVSDDTYFEVFRVAARDDVILNYRLDYGDSEIVSGAFHVDSLEVSGDRASAQTFTTTLSSDTEPVWGKLADFLLDETGDNILDENNQFIQGS